MKTIKVEIDAEGKTRIETTGFTGATCKDATRELERAIGAVIDDTPTRELYQRETNRNTTRA